ncbi:ubinuclein-1-like [Rutidosis leptorrhynchoides]|uniref:ubinuclein-1-like n=1 Tax=Rutidosis leptorrhynchoides TaxID=125765 RepID=UPI003A99372F
MEFGDGDPGSSSSSHSWLMGPRQRFDIELRPGETTIVSWKRLVKDAVNKKSPPLTATDAQAVSVHRKYWPCVLHVIMVSNEAISDFKLLMNFCMAVVMSNGEFISSVNQQVKRRRKNTAKLLHNGEDDLSNNHVKLDLNSAARMSHGLATSSDWHGDVKAEHPNNCRSLISASENDVVDTGIKLEHSSSFGIQNRDASLYSYSKDIEEQGTGTDTCGRESENVENLATELTSDTHRKHQNKSAPKDIEQEARRLMEEIAALEIFRNASIKEKTETRELPDLNISAEPVPLQPMKTASMTPTSKDSSVLRPKGTMLERAIRELEKVVAERDDINFTLAVRPSNMDLNDLETSPVAMKKRLPTEVKQKLAKVARLAQSSQGKISEELVNHLMSILGHLVQLRTLKRNLRDMVSQGLSAKREKADRFQQIKKEVAEMIELKGSLQGCASSGIFTEVVGTEQKVAITENFVMDNEMEDKICDLYDLYVQGMDEDKGPQIRKLYVELVELWPIGAMDKHQIKDGIRRAKERP